MSCSDVCPESRVIAVLDSAAPAKGANLRHTTCYLALAAAVALAGCSADVTRFDGSSLGLSESNGGGASLANSRPSGPSPYVSDAAPAPSGQSYYAPPRAARPGEVRMSALPEPAQPSPPPMTQSEPRRSQPVAVPAHEPRPAPVSHAAKGESIEVQPGDTLFGLSKKHKVSITELMQVNDLKNPNLKPGQKLHLPAGKRAVGSGPQKPLTRSEGVASAPAASPLAPAKAPAPAPASNVAWTGSYTVKSGETLYVIAQRHKVQLAELQSVNGIADARKVRPGTVIKVPEVAGSGNVAAAPGALPPTREDTAPTAPGQQPTLINTPDRQRVAAAPSQSANDASPPAESRSRNEQVASAETPPAGGSEAMPGSKLRWPVKGKVILGFGPRSDGTHNDGINVSVPLGADVHAAEAGVVAYAGNELKGYGNLVLIRHDNGWVTAYAHNDQLMVKRGDKIKRGQVVAKAGKTGSVDQPQVHFELRQGSKPIDPTPFMEKL